MRCLSSLLIVCALILTACNRQEQEAPKEKEPPQNTEVQKPKESSKEVNPAPKNSIATIPEKQDSCEFNIQNLSTGADGTISVVALRVCSDGTQWREVTLFATGESVTKKPSNVFQTSNISGALEVLWNGTSIVIKYPENSKVFKRETAVNGVSIAYEAI